MTVGYGHKILPGESYKKGLSATEAQSLLLQDIASKAVNLINKYVKVPLSQQQFDALASYVFNSGPQYTLIGTKFINKLNNGNYSGACLEIDIVTSGGEIAPGLVIRRADEQTIWNYGTYKYHN